MTRTLLTSEEKVAIAAAYKDTKLSQADLASAYQVSRSTIRRALHEFDLAILNTEASTKERAFLEVLKAYGISTISRLHNVLNKGVQC